MAKHDRKQDLLPPSAPLSLSDERLANLLESMTDGFCLLDQDWTIRYINTRGADLLAPQRPPGSQLAGSNLWQACPDLQGTALEVQYRRSMAQQHSGSFELLHPPLGRWLDVRIFASSVGLSTHIQDISQRKAAEENLRDETRVLELLSNTGAALAGNLDLPALLQETVDAATRISGAHFGAFYYDDAGDAHPAARAVHGISLRQAETIATALRQGPAMRQNDLLAAPETSADGAPPLRSCLSLPISSRSGLLLGRLLLGHPQAGMFSARSERIVAAIAVQAAVALDNTRLYAAATRAAEERKVLLDSEREARAEAARTNQLQDDFLATLSHELRTPLSAILGWAQVLRRGTRDQADLHRGLQSIERNARAQAQLIEDLLDMNRITSDKVLLDLRPLAPASIIASAIETLRPAADAKHIVIHSNIASDADTIMGDPGRIQQVIWNLLSNALKFTPQGGRVDIGVRREASRVAITVADNGVGIKQDFLPHVFDRFRQADASTTRRHGGLGLGLSIVKHLVEQHGGTVTASSAGDMQGASFTVRLPLGTPVAAARKAVGVPSASHDLRGIRVLLVDDEADGRELTERILREHHAEVHGAGSVAQALQLLAQVRPHVLVSDIGRPDADGVDLLTQIRAHTSPGTARLPALALTALAQPQDRQRALASGFQAWVAKPLDPAELVAAVAQLAATRVTAPPLKR